MFNVTMDRCWIPIKKEALNKSGSQGCVWAYYFPETNETMVLSYYKTVRKSIIPQSSSIPFENAKSRQVNWKGMREVKRGKEECVALVRAHDRQDKKCLTLFLLL